MENLVPDKTDEEPSFKVKKVGPNEPLDEKVPINNSDPTGNVFRFYIWPSDVEPKTTSEDAAKEETIETDPTDGKMEDERNSNVFRF